MLPGAETIVCRHENVISETVFADVVVLDPETSRYVRLNPTAAALWEALGPSPATVATLADVLVARFAAPPEQAFADALAFVEAMSSRNLIEISSPV